ncbi:sigma-54-dependent Fis family transcriptional regulator [Elioraea sp. Yellowstone]|jgi:DNA-binding NtrC family response regulator|uniref:sigma-54-dependent transcriptional regulator n=1 Tax=Elioraea sp. Yellowstone TaxID=2592070 RepID=UPI00114DC849|nr:sigma-54 dependent transcriptional regulator [Elioraea sp. Yellowstone]TQF76636.1 sigma-54-dependent Fis family transcriptional regulator [Elioraea sp. Yellowstone]
MSRRSARGRLLLVEDDPVMGGSLADRLGLEGFDVAWVQRADEAEGAVARARPDLVLCDIRLPDRSGEALYAALRPALGTVPVLFMTAFGEIDQAVRLMRAGAADFVTKPFAVGDLLERIETLLRRAPLSGTGSLGVSPAMRAMEETLIRAAAVDSTVLLVGESGSGKEVAARFLHARSTRAAAPFVALNCAAIPEALMERELFGHERGAFTGAAIRAPGYAEQAGEGTLFLDEVMELAPALQAKFLRLIEAREFARLGSARPLPFRARIIAATNADPDARVRDGRFREDLLFRLDVIRVAVPPLRARAEDILPLARKFADEFATAFGRDVAGLRPAAEEALLAHGWPGNVRELRNRVERAVALAASPWLDTLDLFPELPRPLEEVLPTLAGVVAAAERRSIAAALATTGGDVAAAAGRLGIARSTLFEKMRRLGLRGRG